ncbi:DUF3311 domain-containing protein [Cryptosporangium phraense]|uniref:DUF3311 domain-containing protein n=1 Tax=Cryptosporangium phraense TaxID=2593070 RepID=A0A545AT48_9ACTN|nr:DUF3311 domain-containing protein [Cryptosporangium phraense]TQS44516.1 DUF3311 domain-containing protein [Cryptosporangium phraense]
MSTTEETPSPSEQPPARSDRNHWYWLLLVPIVVPLLPMLYNGSDPTLWGIPRFYWLQLLFVVLSVGVTLVVYRQTRGR